MLELRLLETFRVLATTRNFTRTAAELGYSQATISTHINVLEKELGAALFVRGRFSRPILTEVGRRTLEYADRILALVKETKLSVGQASSPPQ